MAGNPFPGWDTPPPLTLDLMAEAEETLTREQMLRYQENLGRVNPSAEIFASWFLVHATKEQRLEAFLKTKGLWQD